MDLLTLVARLTLDDSEYEKGLGDASSKAGSIASGIGKAATVAIGAATTAITGFAAASVNTGMNFDAAMSKVAAISGATGKDFDNLRDKAQEMGASTKFSATEAADAFSYMAMAGWKTNDMLEGIEGVMNLAAASGEGLATTSDIVTDALTAFGLSAKDSTHFADVLAAASSNANTNVSMMGETFKYAAPIAGALGFSAEDTAEAIGLMANAGIKASQAGTSLRMIMNKMSDPIKITGKNLGNVTIATTNADGSMRDLSDILDDCRKAFNKLTPAEKAAAAESIAGKNAMSGFLAIMNAGTGDVQKLRKAIDECDGASKKMAETMNDNLAGDITIFKSALEGAQIVISDKLTPSIRKFVQFGTDGLSKITKALKEGGIDKAMQVFSDVLADGVAMLAKMLPKLISNGIKFAIALVKGVVSGVVKQIPQIAKSFISTIRNEIIPAIAELFSGGNKTVANDITKKLRKILSDIVDIAGKIGGIVKDFWITVLQPILIDIIDFIRDKLIPGIHKTLDALKPVIENMATVVHDVFIKIKGFWDSTLYPVLNNIFSFVVDTLIPLIIENLDLILPVIGGIIAGIAAFSIASKISNIIGIVQKLFAVITANPIALIVAAIATLIGYLVHLYQTNEEARDKINAAFEAIKGFWEDTLKPAFEAIFAYVVDTLIPTLIKYWQEELQPAIESVFAAIAGFWEETLKPALEALYTYVITDLIPTLIVWWEYKLQPAIEGVFKAIKKFWDEILFPVLKAIYTYMVETLIPTLIDWWQNHLQPAISKVFKDIGELWTKYGKPALEALYKFVRDKLPPVLESFGKKFNTIYEKFLKPIGDWIGNTFVAAWDALQQTMKGILQFIEGTFSGDWGKAWEGIVNLVSAPFKLLGTILKEPINVVIRLINAMIKKVESAINTIINGINSHLKIQIDPIYVFGDKVWDGINWGVSIPNVEWNGIKELAAGGMLRPGDRAVVGEYAPELIEMIGNRAVVTPTRSTPGRWPGGQEYTVPRKEEPKVLNITFKLNDDTVLGRAIYKLNKNEEQRVGMTIVEGVT